MSLPGTKERQQGGKRGAILIEVTLVILIFVLTILGAFELSRMLLVYTSLVNASRVGVRYASVHGNMNTGSGVNGPSGPGNTTNIENVVKDYTRGALLDPTQLTINVQYPTGGAQPNAPGSRVRIQVTYPYSPFVVLPLNVTLGTVTEGVITY